MHTSGIADVPSTIVQLLADQAVQEGVPREAADAAWHRDAGGHGHDVRADQGATALMLPLVLACCRLPPPVLLPRPLASQCKAAVASDTVASIFGMRQAIY